MKTTSNLRQLAMFVSSQGQNYHNLIGLIQQVVSVTDTRGKYIYYALLDKTVLLVKI